MSLCIFKIYCSLCFTIAPDVVYAISNFITVSGHFIMSAPSDPQMMLNTTKPKVPKIYFIGVTGFQISIHFALRPAFFMLAIALGQEWPPN